LGAQFRVGREVLVEGKQAKGTREAVRSPKEAETRFLHYERISCLLDIHHLKKKKLLIFA